MIEFQGAKMSLFDYNSLDILCMEQLRFEGLLGGRG